MVIYLHAKRSLIFFLLTNSGSQSKMYLSPLTSMLIKKSH